MSANHSSYDFRIFGIDIGVRNMGMASMVITGDGRTVIEKLDWRPLQLGGKVTIGTIVKATGDYIAAITTPTPGAPFVSGAPRLIPSQILIEQQYVASGINVHALEIQVALMARFAERFPTCDTRSVWAAARKSSTGMKQTKASQKGRASNLGFICASLDSPFWLDYITHLSDSQHTCDAIAMIVDNINFTNLPDLWKLVHASDMSVNPRVGTPLRERNARQSSKTKKQSHALGSVHALGEISEMGVVHEIDESLFEAVGK